MAHKGVMSSTWLALLLVAYNCLAVPVAAIVLVFAWRLANVTIYNYNKYDPGGPALLFLVAAVGAEYLAVSRLASTKNVWGLVVGLGVSLLLSPVTLVAILFSLAVGNR